MKQDARCLLACTLLALAAPAQANDDRISFAQTPSAVISATLSGSIDGCNGAQHFVPGGGVSAASLSGTQFNISSPFAVVDPISCPNPLSYALTVSLGAVPDGHYTVIWAFGPEAQQVVVRAQFDIRVGSWQSNLTAVPLLDSLGSLTLFFLVAGMAALTISFNATVTCRGDTPAARAAR